MKHQFRNALVMSFFVLSFSQITKAQDVKDTFSKESCRQLDKSIELMFDQGSLEGARLAMSCDSFREMESLALNIRKSGPRKMNTLAGAQMSSNEPFRTVKVCMSVEGQDVCFSYSVNALILKFTASSICHAGYAGPSKNTVTPEQIPLIKDNSLAELVIPYLNVTDELSSKDLDFQNKYEKYYEKCLNPVYSNKKSIEALQDTCRKSVLEYWNAVDQEYKDGCSQYRKAKSQDSEAAGDEE